MIGRDADIVAGPRLMAGDDDDDGWRHEGISAGKITERMYFKEAVEVRCEDLRLCARIESRWRYAGKTIESVYCYW